jgi:hypothetical protein
VSDQLSDAARIQPRIIARCPVDLREIIAEGVRTILIKCPESSGIAKLLQITKVSFPFGILRQEKEFLDVSKRS